MKKKIKYVINVPHIMLFSKFLTDKIRTLKWKNSDWGGIYNKDNDDNTLNYNFQTIPINLIMKVEEY